jgi:hypothetical protein
LLDQLKLVCTLYKKVQYKVHLLYLLVGSTLGYRVTKVYGGVKFRQAMIMQNYIMHLANKRKKYPRDTFMNAFLKLLSNALFSKTCENPENYRKTKFAIGDKQVTAMFNRLNIRNFHRIDKENDVVLAVGGLHVAPSTFRPGSIILYFFDSPDPGHSFLNNSIWLPFCLSEKSNGQFLKIEILAQVYF